MTYIYGSVLVLKQKIKELQDQINVIQAKCSHPDEAVEKKHDSNTGNYDPSNDCYWTNLHCHLCDKHWTVDGSV
jgi:hypothetical protein